MNKRLTLLFIFLFFVSAEIIAQDIISTVVWDTPLEKDKFSRLIKVKEGDEFSIKNIRRTVKLLYATKKFEQIAVMLEKEKNGVKLILKGSPQLIITDISIKGNSKFSDRQLKSASGTGKNTYFFTSDLERIRDEIIYFYRENGFFNTLVNIATEKTGENSISLKIVIIEGVQEKINEIRIYGSMNKSEKRKLEYELGVSFKGNPNTDKNINDINEFINTYFKDRGYLDVNVNTDRLPGGKVSFSINKGLLYILDITGDESFSPDTLKTIITGLSNYHFDAEGIKRKLLIFYQAYGFPDAVIDVDISDLSLRKNDQTRTISVNIDEGERRFINDIVFTGGSSFNRNVVVNRLKDFIEKKIEEENFPQIKITRSQTGGGYKDTDNERVKALKRSKKDKVMLPDSPLGIPEAYLEDIKEIVEKVYLNEGYMDISVLSAEIIDNSEGLYLLVGVKENTRFMLTGVTATTGDPVLDRIMKKKILLPRAIPFNENIVEAYRKRIKEFLSSKGYIFAHITHDLEYDGQKILLKFKAEYLFPVKVTEVVIAGNFITEEWAVKGALRIRPGDTLKGDTFQYRRRDLLQTGMYQSVMINFIDPEFPSEEKDVVVVVSEVERFKISPGIGISSDEGGRIFGSAEWRNFGGSGFSTKFSFKISRKIELFMGDEFKKYYSSDFTLFEQFERKFNLAFLFPDLYLPFLPLSAQVEAFHIHDIRSNAGLPYMIDKNGMYFSFFRRFSNNYFLSTGVEIAYQNERDHELDEAGDVYYNNIERLVISPEFRGYIDFRDSLFFPTKGYKTFFKYANKTSVYGEATSISYFENNLSLYIPLRYRMNFAGELEPKDTLIYHAFIETAFLIQHSGDLTSDDVLKLGGNTTIRGFFNDELQPNDLENEKSAEGRYSFVMRNELRFKLIESFYLISFFDMGNLWQKLGNIGDGSLFRYTAGGGLTYASPIGALTAQVGFNIRPRENEGIWAFHIYLSTF
ncbi:MAG TPA: POTRA domain-containing protein [bacterium]|nr:POTRA domain-containing protein [bacterium]HPM46974.1 POTRA domain-containing protein [bacterium]HPY15240.1 POTRA domain-containing protein [bacterium]